MVGAACRHPPAVEFSGIVRRGDLGFEALARWDRPGHGPVSPELFITVAEESGLIADLGDRPKPHPYIYGGGV